MGFIEGSIVLYGIDCAIVCIVCSILGGEVSFSVISGGVPVVCLIVFCRVDCTIFCVVCCKGGRVVGFSVNFGIIGIVDCGTFCVVSCIVCFSVNFEVGSG